MTGNIDAVIYIRTHGQARGVGAWHRGTVMNRLFGSSKNKPENKPTLNDCINTLDSRTESIDGKIRKLEAELKKLKDQMARLPEGSTKQGLKQQALRLLQQKKQYESQKGLMQQQSFNLGQTSFATETLKDTQVMVSAMHTSVKEMKQFHKTVNLDKVEDLRDQLHEMMQDSTELQEIMGRAYDTPDYLDEAELDAELGALDELAELDGASYLDDLPATPISSSTPAQASRSANDPLLN